MGPPENKKVQGSTAGCGGQIEGPTGGAAWHEYVFPVVHQRVVVSADWSEERNIPEGGLASFVIL